MASSRRYNETLGAGAFVMPVVGVALVLLVAAAAAVVVPQFQSMFAGFGADLPGSTRLVLATYRGWALGVTPVAVVWLCVPGRRARAVAALLTGAAIAAVLALFGLWAC
jgi:type II secretory pathway component PulF